MAGKNQTMFLRSSFSRQGTGSRTVRMDIYNITKDASVRKNLKSPSLTNMNTKKINNTLPTIKSVTYQSNGNIRNYRVKSGQLRDGTPVATHQSRKDSVSRQSARERIKSSSKSPANSGYNKSSLSKGRREGVLPKMSSKSPIPSTQRRMSLSPIDKRVLRKSQPSNKLLGDSLERNRKIQSGNRSASSASKRPHKQPSAGSGKLRTDPNNKEWKIHINQLINKIVQKFPKNDVSTIMDVVFNKIFRKVAKYINTKGIWNEFQSYLFKNIQRTYFISKNTRGVTSDPDYLNDALVIWRNREGKDQHAEMLQKLIFALSLSGAHDQIIQDIIAVVKEESDKNWLPMVSSASQNHTSGKIARPNSDTILLQMRRKVEETHQGVEELLCHQRERTAMYTDRNINNSTLRKNYDKLVNHIKPKDIVNGLFSANVIHSEERERILKQETTTKMVQLLLHIVDKSCGNDLQTFIKVLADMGQKEIADLIISD